MMMMADGLLGHCADQMIEGVTVKMDDSGSDPETMLMSNGLPMDTADNPVLHQSHNHGADGNSLYNHHSEETVQEIVETLSVPHLFSTTSAACANCSISFFDPIGNPVYQPIYYMCLDSSSNEAIQISSVIHILFAKKLSRCPNPSPDLALCSKCAELVAQMYQLYRELDSLSAINSYINSFLPDINQVFLPTTPESSNPSIKYAHYEDSISAAINGNSTAKTPPSRKSRFDGTSLSEKILSEPPPLTVPPHYGISARSTSCLTSDLPVKPKLEFDAFLNSLALSNTASNIVANAQMQPRHTQFSQESNECPVKKNPPKIPKYTTDVVAPTQAELCQPPRIDPSSTTMLRTPMEEKKLRTLSCTVEGCSKVYHGKGAGTSLRQHIKIVHLKQFRFACEICAKPLATKTAVEHHVRTHLNLEERRASLPNNATPIPTPTLPEPELLQPSEVLPTTEAECGIIFQTGNTVPFYTKPNQRDTEEPVFFRCEHDNCGKQFRDKSSLRRHEQKHNNNKVVLRTDFACSGCPLRFDSRKKLKEHHDICPALAEKQLQCKFAHQGCGRKFKHKHHLVSHLAFQHKFSTEEARKEVYPGLLPRGTSKKARNSVATAAVVVVSNNKTTSGLTQHPVPPPYQALQLNSYPYTTNHLCSLVPREMPEAPSQLGAYTHSQATTISQNSAIVFQHQLTAGVPPSVIQQTKSAVGNIGLGYTPLLQSVIQPTSSPSVIHHNPSLIQQLRLTTPPLLPITCNEKESIRGANVESSISGDISR